MTLCDVCSNVYMQLLKKNASGTQQQQQKSTSEESSSSSTAPKTVSKPGTKLTALQQKMKEKLSGARFRWLNEQLYTTKGDESFKLFQEKPELFDEVSHLLLSCSFVTLV